MLFLNNFMSVLKATFAIILATFQFVQAQNFNEILSGQGIQLHNDVPNGDNFGAGLSFYDFNQDGWDDLSFGLSTDTLAIYINNQGVFQAAPVRVYNSGVVKMVLWVDYDNDGHLDLFYTNELGNIFLLRNDGNLGFTDETVTAGLSNQAAANTGASFGDYDRDGDLDLYVCKYKGLGDSTLLKDVNNLYRNNGDGTFTDVTFNAGVSDGVGTSFMSVWIDINKDAWPDLFIINDRNNWVNALYMNNGDGTFTNNASSAGLTMPFQSPMTASFADYDNDDDMDLFISNTSNASVIPGAVVDYPFFFVNQNDGTFINEASNNNLLLEHTNWGGLWLDYDNDQDQDLYVATDFLNFFTTPSVRNYFLINNYPNGFVEDSTVIIGSDAGESHAVARGDFNRDGFYDMAVHVDKPSYADLWMNSGNSNNYVKITLEGTVSNKFAIGSWIAVFVNGQKFTEYTYCGENYLGQNSQHHIFGTGSAILVDSVHIEYVSGIIDKYYNLAVNQEYQFTEGETKHDVHIELHGNNPFCQRDSVVLTVPNLVSYLWSNGDTTQSIVVFDGGTYSLSAIDSQGISVKSDSITLVRIDNPQLEAELYNPTCYSSNDGQIILSVQNQGQPYISQWSNGQIGDLLTNLSADWYTLTYQDTFACIYKDSFELIAPLPLNVQVNVLPETDMTFASIQLLVNGGTAPYILMLDGNSVGINIDSIAAGNYLLEVLDSLGCLLELHIVVPFEEDSVISELSSEIAEENICIFYNILLNRIEIKLDNKQYKNLFIKGFDLAGRQLFYIDFSNTEKKGFFNVDLEKIIYQGVLLISLTLDNQRALYRFVKN